MPRKTTGNTTPRKNKTAATADLAGVQPIPAQASREVETIVPMTGAAPSTANGNLDEEIRRRAYELYLQRNGAAGDPNRDWLIAEREVRSRYAAAGR